MTEFKYGYGESASEAIDSLLDRHDNHHSVDAAIVDMSGMSPKSQKSTFALLAGTALKDDSVMVLLYDDMIECMRHMFRQAKSGLHGFETKFTFFVNCGTRLPTYGSYINTGKKLKNSIARVGLVLTRRKDFAEHLFCTSDLANKNLYIEGERKSHQKGSIFAKCIGGDVIAQIIMTLNYVDMESIIISNFGRPVIFEINEYAPKKGTETFDFEALVSDTNIRTISLERMECAVNDIACDFDASPSAQEVTDIMKDLEERGE